ncbi:MAG: hypothetical protein MJ198_09065 [Bacteroidales bacterium]|nr:hypothetical protein [Bacteroidales bacterium]
MEEIVILMLLFGARLVLPDEIDTVRVEPKNVITTNESKFDGWGTSLGWWANRIGYSDEMSQQVADLFFSTDGLGLNIMRYNIAGGDNPLHNHVIRLDSQMPGWMYYDSAANDYVYDYQSDANQLNVLERSYKAAGKDAYLEVYSSSPPYFMTESGCSSGNTATRKDNLKKQYYTDFADYLAYTSFYLKKIKELNVRSLSPMNEPSTGNWWAYSTKQEGCNFSIGASQSNLITEMHRSLKKYGLEDVIIAAGDEASPEQQLKAWHMYSDTAKKIIGRINTHTFDTTGRCVLGNEVSKIKNLWVSESDGCAIVDERAGEMGSPLWLSKRIIEDVSYLGASAWVLWQIIDNHVSDADTIEFADNLNVSSAYRGVAVANHTTDSIELTQKYYALGQFTRHIRPGMSIIRCNEDMIAAYDKKNEKLVIVAVNTKKRDKSCFYDLSKFSKTNRVVYATRTRGSIVDGEHWCILDPIKIRKHGFTAKLKGFSVTTFIINHVKL